MEKIFIISGPSGAGEDSIVKELEKKYDLIKVTTTTTREKREGEKDGIPYYFISKEEFEKGIKENRFFEYAKQDRGNYYGVTKDEIKKVLKDDRLALYRLDYKGVKTVKELFYNKAVAILITAPLKILEKRIRNRGKVSEDFIKARLEYAKGWFENVDLYDYSVENEEGRLDETIKKIEKIITKELKNP